MDAGKRPAERGAGLRALILAFTLGVLAMHALPELPSPAWLLLPLLAAGPRWRGRGPILLFVLGASLAGWQAQRWLEQRWPAERHGEEILAEGRIASLPEQRLDAASRPGEAPSSTWRFVFEPVGTGLPGRVRVAWYRSDAQLKGGDCWRLQLRLRTPRGSLNPGGFDYEGWLFRQGIAATATVRSAEPCAADGGYAVLRWRQALVLQLRDWLDGHPATGLMAALAVGDQSAISDRDWDVFRLTGTTHLVAISGLNIAVVAGFAFFLGRWLWSLAPPLCLRLPAQKAGLLISAFAAIGYSLMAGFEPPVVRAMLMLLIVLAAAWTHRLSQASRVLALAWFLILLLDPAAVLSPGLWLSFGAVAAIFYLTTGRLRPMPLLASLVVLQLLLSAALLPLSLHFFHGIAWAAPLVNLLAVPLFSLLTPVLLAVILLAWALPALGVPLVQATAGVLELARAALGWVAQHSQDLWLAAGPPWAALALSLFGALLLFAPRGLPLRPLGLLCLLPLLLPPRHAPDGGLDLTVLDVGQGLAVVVRTARHALLYDAGPAFDEGFDAGESVVAPYLLTQGIHRLDALLLSHGDNDHAGGLPAVRRLLRVDREIGTGQGQSCLRGERWEWDGVRFEILHPDGGAWPGNNGSCVLRVDGAFSALLTGDIEKLAERQLVRAFGDGLAADVLVAPHHGSRSSSTPEFVAAVHPRLVVYGAAWRSHFGHPRPEVQARYGALPARQYVTGNSGALRIGREGEALVVSEWRREAQKLWNAPAETLGDGYNLVGLGASP